MSSEWSNNFKIYNQFVELFTSSFNVLVATVLFIAPWYKMDNDESFEDCKLTRGTIISPFLSSICGKKFKDIDSHWNTLYGVVLAYLIISILTMFIIFLTKDTERHNKNSFTIGFTTSALVFILQIILVVQAGDGHKPHHVEDTVSKTLLLAAFTITIIRMVQSMWCMVWTKLNNSHGIFGTGSNFSSGSIVGPF